MIAPLKQADYVLSQCGRLIPPPGMRFVDLPYCIPFRAQLPKGATLGAEAAADLTFKPAGTLAPGAVVTIVYIDTTGVVSGSFSLTLAGNTITITPATDAGGVITTTGTNLVTAWNANAAILALVTLSCTNCGFPILYPDTTLTVEQGSNWGIATGASRVENKTPYDFFCRGVAVKYDESAQQGAVPFRVWWPNGRNLEQTISPADFGQGGSAMRTLQPEVYWESAGKVTIELGTPADTTIGGGIYFYFWGVIRYYLKADGSEPQPYLPDISRAPRIKNGPNQNIMAPEWLWGDQCTPETPEGFADEPFTLFSDAIKNPVGQSTTDVAVQIPKDCDWFLIRNIQYNSVPDDGVSGTAAVQIRTPSGYSITNGDYVSAEWNGPIFPMYPLEGGGRIILDVADMDASGTGNITTTLQFDGVKRRRLQ